MFYVIHHWYWGKLPKGVFPTQIKHYPRANKKNLGEPEMTAAMGILIDDIQAFVSENGPIILSAPKPHYPHWHIWVTDSTGRFSQK